MKKEMEIIKKKLPIILLISVMAAVAALVVVKQVKPSYETHFSYIVSLTARDQAAGFRFDGYWGLQATDLFSSTLAKWIVAPENMVAAYHEAQMMLPSDDPRSLARVVKAEKVAPQLVAVTVRGSTSGAAERLAAGLRSVMEKNVATYHDQGVPAAEFTVVPTALWTGAIKLSVPLVVISTFIFTFLIVLNGVILWESLRKHEDRR